MSCCVIGLWLVQEHFLGQRASLLTFGSRSKSWFLGSGFEGLFAVGCHMALPHAMPAILILLGGIYLNDISRLFTADELRNISIKFQFQCVGDHTISDMGRLLVEVCLL